MSKSRQKAGKKPDAYKDYRKILERKDIDAVMIATPDHWHTKIAVEAMLAGKDVYCEKPLTLTIDEGKLIEKIVKQTGRVFQVGTMQRTETDQRFLKAIALIRDGRIGKVKKVTCGINAPPNSPVIPASDAPEGLDWDFWLGPAPRRPYRALPEMRERLRRRRAAVQQLPLLVPQLARVLRRADSPTGAPTTSTSRCWALGATETGPSKVTPVDIFVAGRVQERKSDGRRSVQRGDQVQRSASTCRATWR